MPKWVPTVCLVLIIDLMLRTRPVQIEKLARAVTNEKVRTRLRGHKIRQARRGMVTISTVRICVSALVGLVHRLAASVATVLVVLGLVLALSTAGMANAASEGAPDHPITNSDGDQHADRAGTGVCDGVSLCLQFILPTRFSRADTLQQTRPKLAPPDAQFVSYPLPRIDLPPPRSTH